MRWDRLSLQRLCPGLRRDRRGTDCRARCGGAARRRGRKGGLPSQARRLPSARQAFEEVSAPYWDQVRQKRQMRNAKRRSGETIVAEDYVLAQPPLYRARHGRFRRPKNATTCHPDHPCPLWLIFCGMRSRNIGSHRPGPQARSTSNGHTPKSPARPGSRASRQFASTRSRSAVTANTISRPVSKRIGRSLGRFARRKGYGTPLTAAELEMMNLTGDGNGYDMVTIAEEMRERIPTSNFFLRDGYERNPVAIRNNTVAKLLAATNSIMNKGSTLQGAKDLAAALSPTLLKIRFAGLRRDQM